MTVNELTKIWAKIKALFAPKSDVTALETKINNIIDTNGKIKSDVLPSYVDDVVDGYYNMLDSKMYTYLSNCPEGEECTYTKQDIEIPGESGKIYYAVNNKKIYRFNEGTRRFFEIVDEPDLTNYLTKTEASNTYLTETQANSLYVLQSGYSPVTVTTDNTVTANSDNPVKSSGIYNYLNDNYSKIVHAKYQNGGMYEISGYIKDNTSGELTISGITQGALTPSARTLYVNLASGDVYVYDSVAGYVNLVHELTQTEVDTICTLD